MSDEELRRFGVWANQVQSTLPMATNGRPMNGAPDNEIEGRSPGVAHTMVILPSGTMSISEGAKDIFSRMAALKVIFNRGGAIVETQRCGEGRLGLEVVTPEKFRSRLEMLGRVFAYRISANGALDLKSARCSQDMAKALLASREAFDALPPISMVVRCPVAIEVNGTIQLLTKGYHQYRGGILVTEGGTIPEIRVEHAATELENLLAEFTFRSPGDKSRALAGLVTPALKMGGHLRGHVPVDVAEADQSQSGKTYRLRLTAAVYDETVSTIAPRNGGVGSLDESIAQALSRGNPFLMLDNLRAKLDSPYLESLITADRRFPVRVPNRAEFEIDPGSFFVMLTSNGVHTTPDLANRSSIVRTLKRSEHFSRYPEGDLLEHVIARQSHYLACVFSVIRAWVEAGKPRTETIEHDFREWAQSLDWIVQHIFRSVPLLDGHRGAQTTVSTPAIVFLRSLALTVRSAGKLGVALSSSDLRDICDDYGLEIHGLKSLDPAHAARHLGSVLGRAFASKDEISVDGFTVSRSSETERRTAGGDRTIKFYRFCAGAAQLHNNV
jgi:hypothetical protein